MPPSRRRPPPSAGQKPPVRRHRVAGLRNRPTTPQGSEPERESVSGVLDVPDTEPPATPDTAPDIEAETTLDADADTDADTDTGPTADTAAIGEPEPVTQTDEDGRSATVDGEPKADPPAKAGSARPAGKRRATGITRPADLSAAEKQAGAERGEVGQARVERVPRRRGATQLSVAIVLAVVAVLLAGLAVWFRGEASSLESKDDNTALTDTATTTQVLSQVKAAIEQTFSYNYTDLAATQKVVDAVLTGKARCEYDLLFSDVLKLAPQQKIITTAEVRDVALVRLDGDRAEALVFLDQTSTRTDTNKSTSGEGELSVLARRDGEDWTITEFNMFDRPMPDGEPVPQC